MSAQPAARPFDAFEAHPDPTAVLAPDGTLLRANPAFRATFRHWIGPTRAPWGRVIPPPFRPNGVRVFEAPSPDGRLFEWVERRLPDGARLISARDVTHHARAAEEASRAKTTMFATLTHELRTPLNGVLGMAGLLAQADLEPAAATYVAAIRQSGELLLDLITDILDYSRLEAGHVSLELAPFDPEATMQDVAELLSPKARAKGLELAVLVNADAPAKVLGDDGRLRQVLFNLAGNAVKFTDSGGVTMELSRLSEDHLRFSVRDTGPGVAADKQAIIFEEFAQADAGIARRHGGAGLGLAIVKKLAEAMGGRVSLWSPPGQGASFRVDLPLPEVETEAQPLASLAGARAAVASDSRVMSKAVEAMLSALGAKVAPLDQRPDLMILDWRMAGARDLAAVQTREGRAVVALIAQEERAAIAEARAAGVRHYALKPLRRRTLATRARMALDGLELAPSGREAGGREAGEAADALAGMRVLLAEDNPINALLGRTLLTRMGCTVDVAQDGEEAVAAAKAAPYDLILLDLRMPRLDGFGAAARIQALGGAAGATPLVALTADADEGVRLKVLGAGMVDFVTKPIDAQRLYDVVARFTGRSGVVHA